MLRLLKITSAFLVLSASLAAKGDGIAQTRPAEAAARGSAHNEYYGPNKRVIVFICAFSDRNDSMAQLSRDLLLKTIQNLKPNQCVDLIYTRGDGCVALNASGVESSTPEEKKKAIVFLESTTCTGDGNPLAAMKKAFAEKPDLIYLLSDGSFSASVAEKIPLMNQDSHHRRINVIFFAEDPQANSPVLAMMKKIADDNGGKTKIVALPPVAVAGLDGDVAPAESVAIVCAFSNPTPREADTLRAKVRETVKGLRPGQKFSLLVARGDRCAAMDADGLIPASDRAKGRAIDFIASEKWEGKSDPTACFEKARGEHPKLIYLLTDGAFTGSAAKVVANTDTYDGPPIRALLLTDEPNPAAEKLARVRELTEASLGVWKVEQIGKAPDAKIEK